MPAILRLSIPILTLSFLRTGRRAEAKIQPKSLEVEVALAAKYAAIADIGERAFAILSDLGSI
jgi:hypothetical protein